MLAVGTLEARLQTLPQHSDTAVSWGKTFNIQQKPFVFIFILTNIFFSRAGRRRGRRLDGLDEDMMRSVGLYKISSAETRGSDLCPLSSEHLTEATLPLSRLIVHWKVSSDPPILPSRPEYVLLIAIFQKKFPHDGRYLIRTSHWTRYWRGSSPRPSLSCHGAAVVPSNV